MSASLPKVLIGIVLYNPNLERLSVNLSTCLKQADNIILVDNNSNNISQITESYGSNNKIKIIYNKKNMGIAYALNQILNYAYKNSFKYFLTLDQDSVMCKNYLTTMLCHLRDKSGWTIACPTILDINISRSDRKKYDKTNDVELIEDSKAVITSGCIVNTKAAIKVGGFNNKLFIDYVDVDFNERVLRSDRKILRIRKAILYHELGKSEYHHLLGLKILVDNHNSFRRYYITRNRLYVSRKYFGTKAYLKEMLRVFFSGLKILLFEDDKLQKISSIKHGIKDVGKI